MGHKPLIYFWLFFVITHGLLHIIHESVMSILFSFSSTSEDLVIQGRSQSPSPTRGVVKKKSVDQYTDHHSAQNSFYNTAKDEARRDDLKQTYVVSFLYVVWCHITFAFTSFLINNILLKQSGKINKDYNKPSRRLNPSRIYKLSIPKLVHKKQSKELICGEQCLGVTLI